jgi:iron complex outermembrane receptor protein
MIAKLTRCIYPRAWVASVALVIGPPARADHASDNAVVSAEDAFGLTIGTETIGLYDQNQVRGFSPQVAGNARIGGLYFDQQAPLSNRVLEGSTIRVGISALGYPFPAPTGIVDYDLRHLGDKPALTAVADLGPFDSRGLDLDGQYPIAALDLRVPMGVSYRINAGLPGYTQRNASVGVAPQWTPTKGVAIRAFWDWQRVSQDRVAPVFFTGASSLPPQVPATYLGQDWATGKSFHENYGAIVHAELNRQWTLRAGVFRSVNDAPISYADLFVNTQQSGNADHQLIGYPDQRTRSTSGDVQLVGHLGDGAWRHELVFSLRGRDVLALYDGADVQDVGSALTGQGVQVPRPDFTYGPLTRDQDYLWTAGLAYHGRWLGVSELSAGIERVDYGKTIVLPGEAEAHRTEEPSRLYSVVAVHLFKDADLYAGYTQGIEDSGVAPSNAANRGEILPATLTWQCDGGLKYALSSSVNVIAGVFDVHKPYFNLDASNFYVDLGEQRHRGYEFSIAGEIVKDLDLVAGLEVLSAQVAADGSASVPIGPLAVGPNSHLAQINVDYRLQSWRALSIDATIYSYGRRAASLDNSVSIPGTLSVDVGGRYRLELFQAPATLRFLFQNLGNVYSWALTDSAGFSPAPRRSVQLYLTVDL